MKRISKSIVVTGKVQGVFFRKHTQEKARELGILGWVRNLPDGSVEIAAEGNEDKMIQFVEWCKVGPSAARVDRIEDKEVPESGFIDFQIRR